VLKALFLALLAIGAVSPAPTFANPGTELPKVELFAPSPCLACIDWAEHLRKHGFRVTITETADLDAVKRRLKVPKDVESRHTATVAGYFIEGHVPAEDILTLLKEKPKARGLAVPGLPRGAPGLEISNPTCETACTMLDNDSGVREVRREMFETQLILPNGSTKRWARH
jgi:hypothetical protein